jgi:post-segregation antitoxin (ccd killing protein)
MISSMTMKRVTVTVPAELLEAIRARVSDREMSAYVTEALIRKDEMDRLSDLVDWLVGEHGPVTDAERERARQQLAEIEQKRAAQVASHHDVLGPAAA